ncbi:MAG TPA: Calx-beta domain-containing protein, partial [Woeseiaceae bacterium]|nr:Calx-beta domain-containing protein [Woeseiaceae bacterium]
RVPVAGEPIEIGPAEDFEMEDAGGSRSWLVGLVALLLLLGFAVYQFGFSDRYPYDEQVQAWFEEQLAAFRDDAPAEGEAAGPVDPDAATSPEEDIVDLPADEGPPIAGVGETPPGEAAAEADEAAEAAEGTADAAASDAAAGDAETAPDSAGDDAASRPPADVDVVLTPGITEPDPVVVTLREDEPPTVVDLKRSGNTDLPLHLRIEEVGFSGYQSPWAAGQYTVSAYGDVEIPAGQDRARLSLVMASDKLREADQVSMLRVRSADSTTTQFATLEVQLEDDDQREFESRLPTNTIGFATDQVVVRERDPVVQIDVLRFNPDDSQIVIGYVVSDITAEDGEDYFAPGGHSVSFGPGQRSARLLIPLVQDTEREGDEAFSVELAAPGAEPVPNVYQRIVIMIRDDELAIR